MKTKTSLIIITSLTATFVAICAAVFSVTGISKLFAGAMLSAGIMAASLELGKIVSISFLYQYWKKIPVLLKIYLSTASIVLMVITSAGIYGYLSAAYAEVAADPMIKSAEIQSIDGKVKSLADDITRRETRLDQMISLRSQQESRLDSLVVRSTTGNTTTIRNAQASMTESDKSITLLQNEISDLARQRDSLVTQGISAKVEIDTNSEIGTFIYIAKVFNTELDIVVKWFTLVIVSVFDPLAVALVIAVNFLVKSSDVPVEVVDEEDEKELPNEEPFAIYASTNSSHDEPGGDAEEPLDSGSDVIIDESSNGIPEEETPTIESSSMPDDEMEWMNPGFNWDDTKLWINNPIAKKFKKKFVDKKP